MKLMTWGAIVDSENNYWLPVLNTNSVLKMSKDGNIESVGDIRLDNNEKTNILIIKAVETEQEILLFARTSYDLWSINKQTHGINHQKYYDGKASIADIIQKDKYVVILPYNLDTPFLFYDIQFHNTERTTLMDNTENNQLAFVRAIEYNNYIFTATRVLDNVRVCKIDIYNRKVEFFKTDLRMVNTVEAANDGIWLFGLLHNGKTILRKYDFSIKKVIDEYYLENIDSILENGTMKYFKMHLHREKLFFIPAFVDDIYVFDLKKGEGHRLNYPEYKLERVDNSATFVEIQRKQDNLILFPYGFNKILRINMDNENIDVIDVVVEEDLKRILSLNHIKSMQIIKEGYLINLKELLNVI